MLTDVWCGVSMLAYVGISSSRVTWRWAGFGLAVLSGILAQLVPAMPLSFHGMQAFFLAMNVRGFVGAVREREKSAI